MSQPLEIVNSTDHIVKGEVTYMTIFCTSHYFFVKPNSKWKSEKRGICPIVEVSAEIKTPRGIFTAKPFISIGTTHSRFEVVELRENIFKVIRMRNAETKKPAVIKNHNHSFIDQR
ncbi:hypothetical protein [Epilithonimonas xixisoli]|uniref:Uncharacterized protein n=1 Tax=Epilithonimonas xixisoli TaxID=1476462 RepID=A0A4R8IGH1_9FLAO|nr:hypothetical protein [Epilithonimonas xixisoli]TDX84908.1 hypothetical protein B0I22_2550 [Epilithonimonas xixisoli]